MRVFKALLIAVGTGIAVGGVAVFAAEFVPAAPGYRLGLRALLLGLVFSVRALHVRFRRNVFRTTTLWARMCLAFAGAGGCYVGAVIADTALGGTFVHDGLWALPVAWIIAATGTELFYYLRQDLG